MTEKVEELNELKDIVDGFGSDEDIPAEVLVNSKGDPIKFHKPKHKICDNIQMKKQYADSGVEAKCKTKKEKGREYYVDTTLSRQKVHDAQTGAQINVACPSRKDCKNAHTAIELNFTKLEDKIHNLSGVIKTQTIKMKNDKPIEPWRPCANDLQMKDLPEYGKKKKKHHHDDDENDKGNKKGILERENVFRKPYEKE